MIFNLELQYKAPRKPIIVIPRCHIYPSPANISMLSYNSTIMTGNTKIILMTPQPWPHNKLKHQKEIAFHQNRIFQIILQYRRSIKIP